MGIASFYVSPEGDPTEKNRQQEKNKGDQRQAEGQRQFRHLPHRQGTDRRNCQEDQPDCENPLQNPVAQDALQGHNNYRHEAIPLPQKKRDAETSRFFLFWQGNLHRLPGGTGKVGSVGSRRHSKNWRAGSTIRNGLVKCGTVVGATVGFGATLVLGD